MSDTAHLAGLEYTRGRTTLSDQHLRGHSPNIPKRATCGRIPGQREIVYTFIVDPKCVLWAIGGSRAKQAGVRHVPLTIEVVATGTERLRSRQL